MGIIQKDESKKITEYLLHLLKSHETKNFLVPLKYFAFLRKLILQISFNFMVQNRAPSKVKNSLL